MSKTDKTEKDGLFHNWVVYEGFRGELKNLIGELELNEYNRRSNLRTIEEFNSKLERLVYLASKMQEHAKSILQLEKLGKQSIPNVT